MRIPLHGEWITVQKAGIVDLDNSLLVMAGLFLIFFFLYQKIFASKLVDMFDKRHELTVGSREAAERAAKAAEVRIAEYESRIGEVRRQAVDETKRLRGEGTATERQTLETARTEAAARVTQGIAELQVTAERARADLAVVATATGEKIATKILGGAA